MNGKLRNKLLIIALVLSVTLSGCGFFEYSDNGKHNYNYDEDSNQQNRPQEEDDDDEYDPDDDFDDGSNENDSGDAEDEPDDDEDEEDFDNEEEQGDEEEKDEDKKIVDKWAFSNSINEVNKLGVRGYYIIGDDYNRIITALQNDSRVGDTEVANLIYSSKMLSDKEYYQNYNYDNLNGSKSIEWNGSCYGMSVTTVLKNRNILTSETLSGQKSLSDSGISKHDFSAINYYFWQQMLSPIQTARSDFMALSPEEQVNKLNNLATGGRPFAIDFFWIGSQTTDEVLGHTVVGYGKEDGEYSWERTDGQYSRAYSHRILVYDCSDPDDESGLSDIYYNDEGDFCIPKYGIFSNSNGITGAYNDNGKLGCIYGNDDFLNIVDYKTGVVSNAYKQEDEQAPITTIYLPSLAKCKVESDSGKADVQGLRISNSTYGDDIQTACLTCGKSPMSFIYLPANEKNYNVKMSKDDLNCKIDVGNVLITVNSDSPGSVNFSSNGNINVNSDEKSKKCTVNIVADRDNAFGINDCSQIEVSQDNGKSINIKQGKKGLEIDGDNMKELTVSGYVGGDKTEIDSDTKAKSIELSKSGNDIVVKADSNGDGKYEKTVKKAKIPKNKKKITIKNRTVRYNGKNQGVAKAKTTGKISNVFYLYYKDKKCSIATASHKHVGKYYVKAYALNDDGTFTESNRAKLIIKKGKVPSIKLKNSTLIFKTSDLSKKARSKTIKLTSSNGNFNFTKKSGSTSFTVNKKGKLTVKKGTKNGTYKLKIKVTGNGKNFKKTSKVLTLTVKIK